MSSPLPRQQLKRLDAIYRGKATEAYLLMKACNKADNPTHAHLHFVSDCVLPYKLKEELGPETLQTLVLMLHNALEGRSLRKHCLKKNAKRRKSKENLASDASPVDGNRRENIAEP